MVQGKHIGMETLAGCLWSWRREVLYVEMEELI